MTDKQPDALRLADWLEADACDLQPPMDAAAELRRLHQVEKERDVLLGIFKEACKYAEWSEKVVWGNTARQHWTLDIYLPVPLDEPDKSPEAALKRFIDKVEGEKA
jgi:hypothetical protein